MKKSHLLLPLYSRKVDAVSSPTAESLPKGPQRRYFFKEMRWQSLALGRILSGANQPGVWSPWCLPNSLLPPQDWATSGTNCEPGTSEVCFDFVLISFLPTEKFLLLTLWRTGPGCLCCFPRALVDKSTGISHNPNLSTFPVTVHAYENWPSFTQNKVPAYFPSLLQISCITVVDLKGI